MDFADIRAEFDKTNQAYFKELQAELGDEFERYSNIFKSQEEVEQELRAAQQKLFLYATDNAELFSQQITALDDKQELYDLRRALETCKELFNIMQLFGYDELAQRFTMDNLHALLSEVNNRINLVNLKEKLQDSEDMSGILNVALDQIEFTFRKVSESEMVIADQYQDTLEKTRRELERSLDPKDPEYITLLEELKRIFKKKNIEELTADEMQQQIKDLEHIRKTAAQQNLRDQMLCAKYGGDAKLVLVGGFENEIRKFDSPDILFTGYVSDEEKTAIVRHATVMVNPSPMESLSLLMLEGMQSRIPLLVNGRSKVMKDHCRLSGAGLWYNNGRDFRKKLHRLLSDPELRRTMSEKGPAYVREHYDWEIIIPKLRTLIESI